MVERRAEHGGRGRPQARLPGERRGAQAAGQNYADLAVVLWDEMMRTVEDRKLRRVLFGRITERLAELYRRSSPATSGRAGWSSSARSSTTAGSRPR